MTVAIIDPCPLFRRGLQHSLAQSKLRVSINASSFEQIQDELGLHSLTLCILGMNHGWDPILEVLRRIRKICAAVPIAVLTNECSPQQAMAAIKVGATAVLSKDVPCEALVNYLSLVRLGESILPMRFAMTPEGHIDTSTIATPLETGELAPAPFHSLPSGIPNLSKREAAVLQLLHSGAANKLIAKMLSISEATVKVHVKSVFRKLHVKNRTQAALWVRQRLPNDISQ